MPDERETIYSPERDGGGVRVPIERPAVAPTPDHTGRDPNGPKTAHFDPEDFSDEEMAAAAAAAEERSTGRSARSRPEPERRGATKDSRLKRFLDQ